MDQSQLLQLLGNLRSADNEIRKAAEAQYDAFVQAQPSWMMHALSEICSTTDNTGIATIGLILLRKLFNVKSSSFESADAATQESIKGRMLQILQSAAYGPQRGSAAACVSALAVKVYQMQQDWGALWESIFTILGAMESSSELKTVCCEIINATAVTMAEFFKAHADAVALGLHNCLQMKGEAKVVQRAAFEAVMRLAPLGFLEKLSPLVPVMLGVIEERLNAQDWESAEVLTAATAEGISQTPALFEGHTIALLSGMMQVASSPAVEKGARHMAVETLLTYCESEPKTVRKVPQFAASFFELLFQYTLSPEYDESWDVTEVHVDEEELEENSDQIIGSGGLDRISIALGGRKLQTTAQNLFRQNITGADWKQRNAALLLICYVAEGMSTVFEKMLNTLVPAIVPSVRDEVKYVRASALDCLSQLGSDFAPNFQNEMHAQVLPPVIEALRDPVPHVAASAARCLDTFFDSVVSEDDCDDDDSGKVFSPYVQRVCVDCVALLRSTHLVFVRENALGALSSLISTCKDLLAPYTNDLVPVFREVLSIPDSPEGMNTKCKAIECVTLLACGVGREIFAPYSQDICQYLSSLCANGLRNDDTRSRFVLRGWTCMVECLKDHVLPYLQPVMPMLISMMNLECDAVIVNADVGDDEDEDGKGAQEGIETCRFVIPGVGEKVAKFHTGLIEDKELASNVVNAMLQELGISLAPYFPEIANSAIALLQFMVNASIRENGALILNEIMEAYSHGHTQESQQLAVAVLPSLMAALEEESEMEVMETLMQVVSRCVSAYPAVITAENAHMTGDKLLATLNVMASKRAECLTKKANEHDEDELDVLENEDEELQEGIRSACDLIGVLLERAGDVFAPIFAQNFFPVVATWLQPNMDDFCVIRSLSILCDFVEHAPNAVSAVLQTICASALAFATSRKDADLLQSDFYLLNTLAQYLGRNPQVSVVNVTDFVAHAQQCLAQYFAAPEAKTPEYASTTCNAVSAYISLLEYFGSGPLNSVAVSMLDAITTNLPVHGDEIEAVRVHDRLLGWIANHSPHLQATPAAPQTILHRIKTAKLENLSPDARQRLATM